jgi:hypothetical protein
MTRDAAPAQHVIVVLHVREASCACGAQFVVSSTVADGLSPASCQDKLLDMFQDHRDEASRDARKATKKRRSSP